MDNSKLNGRRVDFNRYLFLGIYFIFLIIQLLSTLNKTFVIPNIVNYGIIVLLIVLILINNYSPRVLLNNVILLGLVGIVATQTENTTLFIITYLVIICSSFVDFKKIMWLHFVTLSIFMLTAFFLYKIGVLTEVSYATYQRDSIIRYTMGYLYPSFMPNLFFHLTLIYIYLRNRINLIEVGVILLINYYIYIYTDTKSAYYLTALVTILSYFYMKFNIDKFLNNVIKREIYFVAMLYFVFIPTWLSYIYDPNIEWQYELNSLLTGRVGLGSAAIEKYGFPLFGENIEWIVLEKAKLLGEYFYVDSSSLNMFLSFGIIFSMIVYILFYKVTLREISTGKNPVLLILLISLLLHSSFDPQFFEVRYNPFILLVGLLINPRREK